MLRKRNMIWAILVNICLIFQLISCSLGNPSVKLTKQYGAELQTVYENYKDVVAVAYETGDTSRLPDVAVGYSLENVARTVSTEDAKTIAEWWKVEILAITVTEYLTDTAEATIEEKAIGDIALQGNKRVQTVSFQRDGGLWKVSNVGPYFTND